MKIFVTGGTGFVGSHLVDALLERGHDVVCLARDPGKAQRIFPAAPPTLSVVTGRLDDARALEEGCDGVDAVFHLAGIVAARNRAEFMHVNGEATATLAKIAGRTAPRLANFVYVSSLAACGPCRRGHPHTESSPPQPVSHYGWSKLAGEEAVRREGIPWTVIRPPTVYGPRDAEVLKVFKIARLGIAPVFGRGNQENSFVFAPDLAEALTSCLHPDAAEKTYFTCHEEVRTQRELAVEIHRALRPGQAARGPTVLPIPPAAARLALSATGAAASLIGRRTILNRNKANEFLAEAWTCSPRAIARDLGWSAANDLHSGLRKTATWYREAGWL